MDCKRCGRWAPDDPQTGYGADDYCPDCLALIENEDDEHADEQPEDVGLNDPMLEDIERSE